MTQGQPFPPNPLELTETKFSHCAQTGRGCSPPQMLVVPAQIWMQLLYPSNHSHSTFPCEPHRASLLQKSKLPSGWELSYFEGTWSHHFHTAFSSGGSLLYPHSGWAGTSGRTSILPRRDSLKASKGNTIPVWQPPGHNSKSGRYTPSPSPPSLLPDLQPPSRLPLHNWGTLLLRLHLSTQALSAHKSLASQICLQRRSCRSLTESSAPLSYRMLSTSNRFPSSLHRLLQQCINKAKTQILHLL